MGKKERHHWVSKSYLKYWTKKEDPNDTFRVTFINSKSETIQKPNSIGAEDRLYDLGGIPIADMLGSWYLEKDLLARGIEPALAKLIPNFKGRYPIATQKEIEGAVFLATQFWGRNPIAIEYTRNNLSKDNPGILNHPYFSKKGNVAMINMLVLGSQLEKGVSVSLTVRSGKESFITSDNPCSAWRNIGDKILPITKSTVHEGNELGILWMFPISPDCLIRFEITGNEKWEVTKRFSNDAQTIDFNAVLRKAASLFVIEGM